MVLSEWILNNKHSQSGFGKLKASRLVSCWLEGPKSVLLGQLQRQPCWTPRCWLWTYSSFLFMEILAQMKNVSVLPKKKKKKKRSRIVLSFHSWRCNSTWKQCDWLMLICCIKCYRLLQLYANLKGQHFYMNKTRSKKNVQVLLKCQTFLWLCWPLWRYTDLCWTHRDMHPNNYNTRHHCVLWIVSSCYCLVSKLFNQKNQ